jgi:hypothetical protein
MPDFHDRAVLVTGAGAASGERRACFLRGRAPAGR